MKKTLFYSSLGGVLEFYDFIIFAIYATIISKQFFPADSAVSGVLLAFAVFAVGYIVRPIGGIVFGHFGDKYGRKKTFTFSIVIMALSTLLIAFVPTYADIGILAPIILTLLRIIQGISIGGEIPGAITFISETNVKHRTFYCAIIFFSLVFGIILGGLINMLLTSIFSPENMAIYGWRVAFIIGGVLGFWGFYLRKQIAETSLFNKMNDLERNKMPIITVLKNHPMSVISGWCLCGLVSAGIVVIFMFMSAYSHKIHLPASFASEMMTVVLFITMIGVVIFGVIGDYISKRLLITTSIIITLIFTIGIYNGLVAHSYSMLLISLYAVFTFGIATAVVPSVLAQSFPTNVRYSGVGLVYNLSFATTGGLAPVIIIAFMSSTESMLVPAYYLVSVAVIAIVGVIFYPKNHLSVG